MLCHTPLRRVSLQVVLFLSFLAVGHCWGLIPAVTGKVKCHKYRVLMIPVYFCVLFKLIRNAEHFLKQFLKWWSVIIYIGNCSNSAFVLKSILVFCLTRGLKDTNNKFLGHHFNAAICSLSKINRPSSLQVSKSVVYIFFFF